MLVYQRVAVMQSFSCKVEPQNGQPNMEHLKKAVTSNELHKGPKNQNPQRVHT